MNTTNDNAKVLRKNGWETTAATDGVACVRSSRGLLAVLRIEFRKRTGAGDSIVKDFVRAIRTYGEPLIRYDRGSGSVEMIFNCELGQPPSLRNFRGHDFSPAFRLRAEQWIATIKVGIDHSGIRTDGAWERDRSPLNTSRRALPIWPHEAEVDLREDLDAALSIARERGDFRWTYEDNAPVSVESRRDTHVRYNDEIDISSHPSDWDPSDPRHRLPGVADRVREMRLEKGLDKPPQKRYVPGQ